MNLLVVLDVLLRKQSVARAANELNLTPSAISHALNRLRDMFGNELLIRDGRRMVPTARAEQLAQSLPKVLDQITDTLTPPIPFEPARSKRTFRLAAPDFVAPVLPHLLELTAPQAPGVPVEIVPTTPKIAQTLVDGGCDAVIGPQSVDHAGVRSEKLGSWDWAVFARSDHPAFQAWSLSAWAETPHIQIRGSGPSGQGPIDRRAAELGVSRSIGAVVAQFSMAAPVLANTDFLLTVPKIALQNAAQIYGLDWRAVPFELPPLNLSLYRSATTGDEAGVQWFLACVQNAFPKLTAEGTGA